MTEKSENQKKNSDRPWLFQPGTSGNPAGRPKKADTFSDIARTLLASKELDITYTYPKDGVMVTRKMQITSNNTFNHSMAAALIKEGMDGNVTAVRELIDRTEGKVTDNIRVGSLDKSKTPLSDEEKAKIAHELGLRAGENVRNND